METSWASILMFFIGSNWETGLLNAAKVLSKVFQGENADAIHSVYFAPTSRLFI